MTGRLVQFSLVILWTAAFLHCANGVFSLDLSGFQLPKINLPLSLEKLFQLPARGESRHDAGRSYRIFSTQIPSSVDYRSEEYGFTSGETGSSEEGVAGSSSHENSIEMETEMKSLDAELVTSMKNHKQYAASTPSMIDDSFSRPQNGSFFPDLSVLKQLFQWGGQSAKSFAICHACKVGIGLFMLRARAGVSQDSLLQTAQFGCNFFKIAPDEMCQGLISRFGPVLLYIVKQRRELTADVFCGMILQSVGCSTKDPNTNWEVVTTRMPSSSTPAGTPQKRSHSEVSAIPRDINTMKILHITDIHVDPHYIAGGKTDCDTEICCRTYDRGAELSGLGAGLYGDYRKCDMPYRSFENALAHIAQTHPDIDLIYMTGDLVPHNVWSTDAEENIGIIRNCSDLFLKYFPNTTVIPVVGNHETHPVNLFSPHGVPPRFSTDWVYATSARSWSRWIPPESIPTFLHAGFYSVTIRPDFKVVVLNTNLCYTYNFWQMYDDKDPSGQLKWLANELQNSEDVGQKVHIVGHVPPGQEDCWSVWSKNFYNIITRYSSTVRAQFYGHTHFDEFKVYYHPIERGRAINSMWIGGSLTPYTNLNPGYKIFDIDGARGSDSSYHVLDNEAWIYDLSEANAYPGLPPRWFRLYRATELYRLPDLLPDSLNKLVRRMSANMTEFNQYYRNYYKAAGSKRDHCDALCRKRHLCNIVAPYHRQQTECMHLQSDMDGFILPMKMFEPQDPSARYTENLDIIVPVGEDRIYSSPATERSLSFFDRIFGSRRYWFGR